MEHDELVVDHGVGRVAVDGSPQRGLAIVDIASHHGVDLTIGREGDTLQQTGQELVGHTVGEGHKRRLDGDRHCRTRTQVDVDLGVLHHLPGDLCRTLVAIDVVTLSPYVPCALDGRQTLSAGSAATTLIIIITTTRCQEADGANHGHQIKKLFHFHLNFFD